MPKVLALLEFVSKKVGFWELLIPLIPVFAELLQDILANCATTEEAAVALLAHPTDRQLDYMHRKAMRAVWREKSTRRLPRAERRALAWQMLWRIVDNANEDPEAVCAAWQQVHAAAA